MQTAVHECSTPAAGKAIDVMENLHNSVAAVLVVLVDRQVRIVDWCLVAEKLAASDSQLLLRVHGYE